MHPAEQPRGGSRETRLLVVTIAVSVGVLLLLARFRFPEESVAPQSEPAPAPLERLAARAAYDELAATMADLERRIGPRTGVVRVLSNRLSEGYAVAPRLTPDRAVVVLAAGERLSDQPAGAHLIAADLPRHIGVLGVPWAQDAVVTPRIGTMRAGPQYMVVVEGSAHGALLRPVYVGRTTTFQDERTGTVHLALSALQHPIPTGSALFSLDGAFIGLVRHAGTSTLVIPGEFLRAAAEGARAVPQTAPGSLGLEIQPLDEVLARVTGTQTGIIVSHVPGDSPAAAIVRSGDVVQAVDGTPAGTPDDFRQLEVTRTPGRPVTLRIVRNGTPQDVTVVANGPPPRPAAGPDTGIAGRTIAGLGIEVAGVRAGTAAEGAGVRRGDLIVALNGELAPDLRTLDQWYRTAKPGAIQLLTVDRATSHLVLALEKR